MHRLVYIPKQDSSKPYSFPRPKSIPISFKRPNNMAFTNLMLYFLSFTLITINSTGTAQDHEHCYDTGNFTTNSSYGKNRDLMLSSLPSDVSKNGGFYNATTGQDPDKVYALSLCRGDSSPEICSTCLNKAVEAITTKCPNQKEAISWGADPPCIVRYANRSFYGKLELDPSNEGYNTANITSNLTQFDQIWESLLDRLVIKASSGSSRLKFATGEANLSLFSKIYALMQCTPDISKSNCDFCLRQSVAAFQNCCHGKQGGFVQRPSCIFRWDLYPFYGAVAENAPVPSPQPLTNTTGIYSDEKGSVVASGIVVVAVVSTIIFVSIVAFIFVLLRSKLKQDSRIKSDTEGADQIETAESLQFDFRTIRVATDNFSIANKLGEGGYGAVFKGRLPDGLQIAVKRLSRNSGQGGMEFKNEVLLLARLQHRNLVRLLGFCLEGNEMLIIYEFVAKSSLDNFIFDPIRGLLLDWEKRYKIIEGIARGMLYLHEDSRLKIIHRDLKASNILLDGNFNPKISDFGMAKLFKIDQSQGNTCRIAGTFGYMAPEYAMYGQFSIKSDVFSFGVLVLEIISGKKVTCFCNGEETENLLAYAWDSWKEGRALNLIDRTLRVGSCSDMIRCIHIGLLCVQENEVDRPTMASVVLMLSSCSLSLPVPSKPAFLMHSVTELDYSELNSKDNLEQFTANEASITELEPR
ncbi:Cysteine rich receptor like kinase [Melia azedarach]|uniref:Cysteine rich receptor like kinase n=1 Tax=Melia azedarach TaxID=155640 RepID=A0ACC1WVR7_MELAZ|nr:Cysteine rich receptor like kinase [Melia azedarach]